MRTKSALAACIAALITTGAAGGEFAFDASTFLGGGGDDDSVLGACVLSDGTIVVAADLAPDALGLKPDYRGRGCVIRLSADGRKVLYIKRMRVEIQDAAFDAADNIYLAGNAAGIIKLDGRTGKVLWARNVGGLCTRVGASGDGHCVALALDRAIAYKPNGKMITVIKRYQKTEDVCIDPVSKTIITVGHRFARAPAPPAGAAPAVRPAVGRAQPFGICFLRGTGYDGKTKWTGYDWSTNVDSERFINGPGDNSAYTRGYRCSIGRDGRLYAAFELGGENHVLRYAPDDVHDRVKMAGGDKYHSVADAEGKSKIFVGRYDPGTGRYLAGQQFCGRLASGRGNNVRVEKGDVTADEHGRVYVVGKAANGLPLSPSPPGLGRYAGGGFVLVLSSDMGSRLACTRTQAGGGSAHCVDGRVIGGAARAVYGGSGMEPGKPMFSLGAVQEKPLGKDGFLAMLSMAGAGELPAGMKAKYAAATAASEAAATAQRFDPLDPKRKPGPKAKWQGPGKGPKAGAIERWETRMLAVLKARLAAGKRPRFRLGSLGKIVRVVNLKGERTLVLASGPMQLSYKLERLKQVEKKYLAVALVKKDDAESYAVAAFFLLVLGETETSAEYLEKAGDKAAGVRAAFE